MMRKYFLALAFILAAFIGRSQTDTRIVLGTIDSMDSKILKEKRKLWVYVPNGAEKSGPNAQVKYPVVYLLDGDAHFYSVVGMIQQLSSVNGNTICPEMIVVGIPNTDRMRDLTPTHIDIAPMIDSNAVRTSGGGEQFTAFLEKEVIPYIESTYPTLPYRTLIGHSLGGLTVMNMLINHKDLFNAYVAIDPSMFWDNRNLLKKATGSLAQQDYKGKTLFLGIANTMRANLDTVKVKMDTSFETDHIRSILTLNNMLQKNKRNGLAYDYQYYKGDSHGSVPLIATYDALHFIFKFYDFTLGMEDYMNFSMNTIKKVEDHYKEVSRQFGFAYPVPEGMINQLGYMAMSQKKMEEAEYLFKSNVTNYPKSLNAYDSLGDFYAAKGDKEKAIGSYKKALSIKESAETRNKLNELLK